MTLTLLAAGLLSMTSVASAAATSWFQTEGGDIRLLLSGEPDENGLLLGALEIRLKPGWKTYWRDPGGAGIPLQMDLSRSTNISSYEVGYPAPRRFDDGYSAYAGYDRPVTFALTFTVPDPGRPATIDADVFLGICETICIPVQTTFQLAAAREHGSTAETGIVAAAHAGVPAAAEAGFQVADLTLRGDDLLATVETTASGEPVLFVTNTNGWYFGTPAAGKQSDGIVEFRIPVLERPAADDDNPAVLDYTLVVGSDSVEGLVKLPH